MGLCASSNVLTAEQEKAERLAKENSNQIDKELDEEEEKDRTNYKILLLGPGDSGKSTFFKQMTQLYGLGFPEDARKLYRAHIYRNIIVAIQALGQAVSMKDEWKIDDSNVDARDYILNLEEDATIDPTVGGYIQQLWKDPGVKAAYNNRHEFQLDDSAPYYFDRMETIMEDDYLPSEQDVFHSRVATTGIIDETFNVDGHNFQMFDVGGQRSERKKWIHCFEHVTAVLFVASLSGYNQMLYEDETQNRLKEALALFNKMCNNEWFQETAMILFLNKKDLFIEKLKTSQLSDYFPEYDGENTFEPASAWVRTQFEMQSEKPGRQIFVHITCATDTQNIFVVFKAVKDIVIKNALRRAGLM